MLEVVQRILREETTYENGLRSGWFMDMKLLESLLHPHLS